ncbi:MAG TPA: serine/threonine-protein kinase [Gemmataceae bacterium]|nr:serine/threonine-protein kinase [Gemmataceae bacterium]
MKFTYTSGQRPLEGFTLKRGIGRGGFGEVYFAVSDGGKEVALKLVRGDTQIELRGVAQCLNLKHPNLVNLYDLRTDNQGDHWVVLEYIAGEPLNVILGRHPNGLPRELVREWFLGLARAVAYLHDHGIVHRDLKPANIFLENGTVKVGDYGLSKSIGSSQRTAQTHSVGTVHYMAPEISTGNYGKPIDTYAAGIILYEMLTGRVPFDGESSGEILMKHLTTPPDLSKVPKEYLPIVAKALSKNPSQRYASMAEMARAVEATGVASAPREQPARGAQPALGAQAQPRSPAPHQPEPVLTALPAVSRRAQLMELCGSMLLAVVFTGLASILWTAIIRPKPGDVMLEMGRVFFPTVAACWALLIPSKFWTERRGDSWLRRFALLLVGGLVGLSCWWMDGGSLTTTPLVREHTASLLAFVPSQGVTEASYFSFYGLAFFAMRWWRMTGRRRAHRFSFAPILGAGFWGLVLTLLIRPLASASPGLLVLVMTATIVQLVSPWEQPPAPSAKRLRLRYA